MARVLAVEELLLSEPDIFRTFSMQAGFKQFSDGDNISHALWHN